MSYGGAYPHTTTSQVTTTTSNDDYPVPISSVAQTNPVRVTLAAGHRFPAGCLVHVVGVAGMHQLNAPVAYTVTNPTSSTVDLLGVDATLYTAYDDAALVGGAAPSGTVSRAYQVRRRYG